MLNISPNSIRANIVEEDYKSLVYVASKSSGRIVIRLLSVFFFITLVIVFLPWTQNIRARGNMTTLRPDQRPQAIHSILAGRIEKWFVQEGDFVRQGDTILFISEIKDDYFDPNLLARTQEQVAAKRMSVASYQGKAGALDTQIEAITETADLKLEQAKNKLQQARLKVLTDSIDYRAAAIGFDIAKEQYERMEELYKEGLKSLTDLENRNMVMQRAQATMLSTENRLLTSRNEILNAEIELVSIPAKFRDDVSKAASDKFSTLSAQYDTEATVTKLSNQYANYSIRSKLYYITAPQDGYVTLAMYAGIGETIKEGDQIVTIMPDQYDLAIEIYVKPLDLPLLETGQPVRIQFDGWPAIVFSGWPNTSYGTYGGLIYAVDNSISQNGMYRALVSPDPDDAPWPDALRVGAGANGLILLKDVPIWYELWRQINGFPPDYYKPSGAKESDLQTKRAIDEAIKATK